jgi:hypothetical protein
MAPRLTLDQATAAMAAADRRAAADRPARGKHDKRLDLSQDLTCAVQTGSGVRDTQLPVGLIDMPGDLR